MSASRTVLITNKRGLHARASAKFVTLASGFADDGDALPIRAEARVMAATVSAGDTATHEIGDGRHVYLVPATGRIEIDGEPVETRDGVALTGPQIVTITGFSMGVNYGTEKVRFPSPVPVGARVRAGATMESATPFAGGIAMNLAVTMEIEGGTKPAMVATVVYRRYV